MAKIRALESELNRKVSPVASHRVLYLVQVIMCSANLVKILGKANGLSSLDDLLKVCLRNRETFQLTGMVGAP